MNCLIIVTGVKKTHTGMASIDTGLVIIQGSGGRRHDRGSLMEGLRRHLNQINKVRWDDATLEHECDTIPGSSQFGETDGLCQAVDGVYLICARA